MNNKKIIKILKNIRFKVEKLININEFYFNEEPFFKIECLLYNETFGEEHVFIFLKKNNNFFSSIHYLIMDENLSNGSFYKIEKAFNKNKDLDLKELYDIIKIKHRL